MIVHRPTSALIPDFFALVGDAQDGYPGIRGIGRTTAALRGPDAGSLQATKLLCRV